MFEANQVKLDSLVFECLGPFAAEVLMLWSAAILSLD